MNNIALNLLTIKQRIIDSWENTVHRTSEVKLLLAAKTVSVDKIKIVFEESETLIGENKVQ